ncbi:MAG TPA: DinB family protein [Terriglobales bacterium]|nr:DinB family protein [Terriglobales bacterium]
MTETAEEYKSRFAAYVEGKDPIAMQREAPDTIAGLIAGIAPARLKQPPAPGKWSVLQIIAHLAEDELASSWRYRQMLEHDGAELSAFDQDLWARVGDYSSWQHEEALTMFRLLRQANLRMFARLSPQQWQRCGTHTERGKVTIRELCRHMAAHDVNHIEQIKRILNSRSL